MALPCKSLGGIALVLFATSVANASAKSFLNQGPTQEEVEASLMKELAGTFRSSATQDHIISLEAKLKPMVTAVPRNEDGSLSHTVVRYVLHRFFSQRGWFIRGLEPAGTKNIDRREMDGLREWVPNFLQDFLEQLNGGKGSSLRELAVLAATLEDLIHKESVKRLKQTFEALELSTDELLDESDIKEALEVFMMIYQTGGRFTQVGREAILRSHKHFLENVKDWNEMQEWMGAIKREIHPAGPLDFNTTTRIVEAIGERYGKYNEKECGNLKSELLDVESKKAGRVRLPDFYNKGLSGVFEFNEKIDYLRALGAADDADSNESYVIIPNYVTSRPQCLRTSSFYVICCRNECEDLMTKLEAEIEDEMATPEYILHLVATLSTDTIEAPRKLSTSLTQRLHSIAKNHDGQVPLHGRLFAQWMHHAFPRECPYPHESGRANPQTPDEWMKETGHEKASLSREELQAHANNGASSGQPIGAEARKHHDFAENELPWTDAEELLTPFGTPKAKKRHGAFYSIIVFVTLSVLSSILVWLAKSRLGFYDNPMEPSKRNLKSFGGPDVFSKFA